MQTPAQDRLKKLVHKNKTSVAESLKELVDLKSKTTSSAKINKPKSGFSSTKKAHIIAKSTNDVVDSAKQIEIRINRSVESIRKKNVNEFDKSTEDEIPPLFASKNIAQERLRSLQRNLSVNTTQIDHDATRVFGESFGIENAQHGSTTDNIDEEMDWEPCEDANYTFQHLESMAVDILNESAYIIPDTNVFLDSLASIKSVIEKGLLSNSRL